MKKLIPLKASLILACATMLQAQELVINGLEGNGTISWSNTVPGTVYLDIEWAPGLDAQWTNSWNDLTFITNTVTGSADVPLFYRLVAVTNVSDTVYGDWGLRTQSAVDAGYPDVDHFFLKQQGNVINGTFWGEDPEDQNLTVVGSVVGTNVVIIVIWTQYGRDLYPGTITSNNTYMSGTYITSEGETDTWWAIRR